MGKDFAFKGTWLINYESDQNDPQEILIVLAKIQDYFNKRDIKFNSINIKFKINGPENCFFKENENIFLNLNDSKGVIKETGSKPTEIAEFKPLKKPIKTISLLFPRLESDPRWKTIGLPAGHILLAASLTANGFEPSARPLSLSGENRPSEELSADMTGITLFEDLLPLLEPFLADFRGSHEGILAVGGPFPTLAPLAAIYHLPQVNLFVRGEAELALPGILQALNRGDGEALFANTGLFWQQPGVIAMAGFDKVIRPDDLGAVTVDLDFMNTTLVEHGLEMNFSRGCKRACVFCCRAQGAKFRKLPLEKAGELLANYSRKASALQSAMARTVNINDDDILQDPDYARGLLALIRKNNLRIFGVQTSTASLIKSSGVPDPKILDLVADPGLYVGDKPLLWLGTDAFLSQRARRLGKKRPPAKKFKELLKELEKRNVRHFHYWISSDGDSTWLEFVEELALIFSFFRDFSNFGLLAHAPFVVPYPSSALFKSLAPDDPRLKIKLRLDAPDARFSYRVIDRLETRWPQLNALLRNEKAGGEKSFFDFLKEKDLMAAAQLAYHFLKQEMLLSTIMDPNMKAARVRLEETITELLELK